MLIYQETIALVCTMKTYMPQQINFGRLKWILRLAYSSVVHVEDLNVVGAITVNYAAYFKLIREVISYYIIKYLNNYINGRNV